MSAYNAMSWVKYSGGGFKGAEIERWGCVLLGVILCLLAGCYIFYLCNERGVI